MLRTNPGNPRRCQLVQNLLIKVTKQHQFMLLSAAFPIQDISDIKL